MKRIFSRIEWCFWQRLLPKEFHRSVTGLIFRIMKMGGLPEGARDHWAWEMTPMPCGFPFLSQHWNALRMAWAGEKGWGKVASDYEVRWSREWLEYKKSHPEEFSLDTEPSMG